MKHVKILLLAYAQVLIHYIPFFFERINSLYSIFGIKKEEEGIAHLLAYYAIDTKTGQI